MSWCPCCTALSWIFGLDAREAWKVDGFVEVHEIKLRHQLECCWIYRIVLNRGQITLKTVNTDGGTPSMYKYVETLWLVEIFGDKVTIMGLNMEFQRLYSLVASMKSRL